MNKGLSLIEILVVVAIIVIVSAVALSNYKPGEKQLALQRAANKLAQDLRRTQEMAMSARKIGGIVYPRYGLEFNAANPGSFIIFGDQNDNGRREPGDFIIETVDIGEKNVTISQIFTGNPISPVDQMWVTFMPPDPTIDIRTPAASGFQLGQVQLAADNKTKTVIVNIVGLVYVE